MAAVRRFSTEIRWRAVTSVQSLYRPRDNVIVQYGEEVAQFGDQTARFHLSAHADSPPSHLDHSRRKFPIFCRTAWRLNEVSLPHVASTGSCNVSPARDAHVIRLLSATAQEQLPSETARPPSVGILVEQGLLPPRDESAGSSQEVIRAHPRPGSGKIHAKRDRRAGRVPSIVFEQRDGHSGGHKRLVSLERVQVERLLKRYGRPFFMSRIFDVDIVEGAGDGEEEGSVTRIRAIPKRVHRHGATEELLNVTLMRVFEGEGARAVKVDIPVVFEGEDACPGIRKGGWLFAMRRTVPFKGPASAIPPFLSVDVSALEVGQKVVLADIPVHPQLQLCVRDPSLPVCKIAGSKSLAVASEAP